jgi:AcrR family transcriptional regulator
MAATIYSQTIKSDSKQFITESLFSLMETNKFSDITISQIVKKAGVSRMAFYRNFVSTEDIIIQYFDPIIELSFSKVINTANQATKLTQLTIIFDELTFIFELVINQSLDYLIRPIFESNIQHFYDQLIDFSNISADEQTYYVTFMSSGVYALWKTWLSDRSQVTIEKLHEILFKFQTSTIQAFNLEYLQG